jgi:hypothetical protein
VRGLQSEVPNEISCGSQSVAAETETSGTNPAWRRPAARFRARRSERWNRCGFRDLYAITTISRLARTIEIFHRGKRVARTRAAMLARGTAPCLITCRARTGAMPNGSLSDSSVPAAGARHRSQHRGVDPRRAGSPAPTQSRAFGPALACCACLAASRSTAL